MKHYPQELSPSQILRHKLDEPVHFLFHTSSNNMNTQDIIKTLQRDKFENTCFSLFRDNKILLPQSIPTFLEFFLSVGKQCAGLIQGFLCGFLLVTIKPIQKFKSIYNNIRRQLTSVASSLLLKSEHCRIWTLYLSCKSSSCCL